MREIVEFSDYLIQEPDWFVDTLQERLNRRDVSGLTGGRAGGLKVQNTHPIAALTGVAFGASQETPQQVASRLPSVSVVMAGSEREPSMLGHDHRSAQIITRDDLAAMRSLGQRERNAEALVTTADLDDLEAMLDPDDNLKADVRSYHIRSRLRFAVWCQTVEQLHVLGEMTETIVYSLQTALAEKKVTQFKASWTKDLQNFNFGLTLHGWECSAEYVTRKRILTAPSSVLSDPPGSEDIRSNLAFYPDGRPEEEERVDETSEAYKEQT